MKLFYNEKRHTLVRFTVGKKVAPLTEFECDANEAADLMKKYNVKGKPKKLIEAGSPEHKEIMAKISKGSLAQSYSPGTRPEEVQAAIDAQRGFKSPGRPKNKDLKSGIAV